MDKNTRIGVLMGGCSPEREISLKSGKAVQAAFKERGFDVVAIDLQKEARNYAKDLITSYDIGLGFLVTHGGFGEDGRLQKILEEMHLVFTGSGSQASSLAMDKAASRKIFEKGGLSVPKYCILGKKHRRTDGLKGFPLVVKPINGGSSIGLSVVDNAKELKSAVEFAFKYGPSVMVEEYVKGREMTVGILEDKPLGAIEIVPKRRFFDFTAKYENSQTEYISPARIDSNTHSLLQGAALRAHKLLGCAYFSRVDMILSEGAGPVILELNTLPGFTLTSLLPKAAQAAGISFGSLVENIAEAAIKPKSSLSPF